MKKKNSLPIIPHPHFTEMGQHNSWCENYHLIARKVVEVPDQISCSCALCMSSDILLERLYLQQLSFSLIS